MKSVSLVTLEYKNPSGLGKLITSVCETADYDMYEWVIHDNSLENIGIMRGMNLLFTRMKGEYILLLNDDMHPTKSGWLKSAMETIKEKEVLTPRIYTGRFGSAWEVAPMLAHRSIFSDAGGLDERFIGYGSDDTDWCIRARLFGWKPKEFDFGFKHTSAGRGDFSKRVDKFKKINAEILSKKWGGLEGEVASV